MKGEDADIVRSVLSGNEDDFRILVEKYQYPAERWAFHHARNLSDAESIAQEAFVEAYFRLNTLSEPHKFGSWLRSIVSNTAISWLRRRRPTVSFQRISGIYSHEILIERYDGYEAPTPEDLLQRQEQAELLQAAISTLPPMHQRVITMFYFDSCSYKQIALQSNTSVSAVKSMLHRARQSLKKEMMKNGWEK